MKEQFFKILASYFQVYFEDISTLNSYGIIAWDNYELETMSFASRHAIALATFRDSEVPIIIKQFEYRPILNFEQLDHIVECGIEIVSGTAVLYGLNDAIEDFIQIPLDKGLYGVLICFAGAATIDEMGLEGNDNYTIVLWKEKEFLPKKVLKQITES